MQLFNKIASSDLGMQIPVQFMRGNSLYTTTFMLFNLADPTAILEPSAIQPLKKQIKKIIPETTPTAPGLKRSMQPFMNDKPQEKTAQQNVSVQSIPRSIPRDKHRDLDAMKRFGGKSARMIGSNDVPLLSTGS